MNCNKDEVIITISEGGKDYPIREKDLFQFNAWCKSKDIVPDLRSEFGSALDYERFMRNAQIRAFEQSLESGRVKIRHRKEKLYIEGEGDYNKLLNSAREHITYEMKRSNKDIRIIMGDAVANVLSCISNFKDMLDIIWEIDVFYHTVTLGKEGDDLFMIMKRVIDKALHDDLCEEFDDLIVEEKDYMIEENNGVENEK